MIRRWAIGAVAALGVALLPSTLVAAPPGFTEDKLTASDAGARDHFGFSVAASGDRIVVGANGDDDAGADSGSAYVYEPDGTGGYTETKFTASDATGGDSFGGSVATAGDRIVVGARFDTDGGPMSGSAYVYEPDSNGGYTETKLTASDAAARALFGTSVATAGDRIVVGASADDNRAGSAYVYEPDGTGGYTETKLTASDAAPNDVFGTSVAAAGDRIVVGANGDDDAGTNSGSAYVYEPDGTGGYTETKLTASDATGGDSFGGSVASAGDRIVVGAYGDDHGGSFSGSAYVYEPDGTGGYDETKLTASDATGSDSFGGSVASAGDRIVVGAYGDDDGGSSSGSAYVYEPDGTGGYTETKLTASDAAADDIFGYSVATAGDRVVVGAQGIPSGDSPGSAYVFEDRLGCTVTGTDGDDTLRGGPGDVVCGGDGNDRLSGGDGTQIFHGGAGDDTIRGESDQDQLFGDDGNDILRGGSNTDELSGGAGDDRLFGDSGTDTLDGGADTDRLDGGSGRDTCSTGEILRSCP